MVYVWDIFGILCIGMMLYFMFFGHRDSDHGHGCFGMMQDTKEHTLEKEVEALKEEVHRLKEGRSI